jgi:hypothetical protein
VILIIREYLEEKFQGGVVGKNPRQMVVMLRKPSGTERPRQFILHQQSQRTPVIGGEKKFQFRYWKSEESSDSFATSKEDQAVG